MHIPHFMRKMPDVATQTFSPRGINGAKETPCPATRSRILTPRPLDREDHSTRYHESDNRDVQLASFLPSKASTVLRCLGVKTWRISACCAIRRLLRS